MYDNIGKRDILIFPKFDNMDILMKLEINMIDWQI